MKNRPVRTGMCRLPAGHTFPVLVHRISQYETRSSRYRSRTDVRSLAPSLQNLTGKRSVTYRIAPFMVELFTAGRLNRSPRRSDPGALCRQRAAPHASRVERARQSKPGPHGRDFFNLQLQPFVLENSFLHVQCFGIAKRNHPLCSLQSAAKKNRRGDHFTNTASFDRKLRKRDFRIARYSHHSIVTGGHWIERRDYFDGGLFFQTTEA